MRPFGEEKHPYHDGQVHIFFVSFNLKYIINI